MTRRKKSVSVNLSMSYLLIVLLLLCYLSFWYSSLKVFKATHKLNIKNRIFFKLVTIGLWNYSIITLGFMSADLWGQLRTTLSKQELFFVLPMLVFSLTLFWYAKKTIERVKFDVIFSQKAPEVLVTKGPYRYIRHPFYTSYMTAYLGLIILNYNLVVSFLAGILIADYILAAKNEEKKFLNSSFSDEYKTYKAKTKMFFPFVC